MSWIELAIFASVFPDLNFASTDKFCRLNKQINIFINDDLLFFGIGK